MAVPDEESTGRRRRSRRRVEETPIDEVDRLSNLPESIIIQILSFLETKDAVRTSVLSQQWRSLWTSVPTLSLRLEDFPLYAEFQRFMEKALGRHRMLNKFLLDLDHPEREQLQAVVQEHVDSWLQHAANCDVGTLHLDAFWGYRLPEFLFGRSSLTRLSTHMCNYECRSRVSWGSLTFLSIDYCSISYGALASIFSGSPVLQHLELKSCHDSEVPIAFSRSLKKLLLDDIDHCVKISAPNLETVEISGHWESRRQVKLLNLPALVEANLKSASTYRERVVQLLQEFSHADKLGLGDILCRYLSKVDVKKLRSISNCSVLHMWMEELDVSINKLLQISPFLQTLVINISKLKEEYDGDCHRKCWLSPKGRTFKCLKHSLKTVIITGFKSEGSNSLMIVPFVEFLLREAQVLENLNIYSASCERARSDPKVSKLAHKYFKHKLLNLPRSSQSAVVAFHA